MFFEGTFDTGADQRPASFSRREYRETSEPDQGRLGASAWRVSLARVLQHPSP